MSNMAEDSRHGSRDRGSERQRDNALVGMVQMIHLMRCLLKDVAKSSDIQVIACTLQEHDKRINDAESKIEGVDRNVGDVRKNLNKLPEVASSSASVLGPGQTQA